MTWTSIGIDVLIIVGCYAVLLAGEFARNFVTAPARLEREAKRIASRQSINEELARQAAAGVEHLERLMDADDTEEPPQRQL